MAIKKKTAAPKKKTPVKSAGKSSVDKDLTAKHFIAQLKKHQSDAELKKYERFFKFSEEEPLKGDKFIGVRMGTIFNLAKEFMNMPLAEIEKLMEAEIHEVRVGALSIMGKKASHTKTTDDELKGLYKLYIRRHDRINAWDLVDLAAYHVVGRYLDDKPRDVLYKLAKSKNTWERRTAIVATAHFIRQRDTADTYKIAAMLVHDKEDLIHKATGWMLRAAGGPNRQGLINFLDKYAATMPRTTLRAALEHFDKKQREYYMALGAKK
ncbi:MAG TPA: DNA alkylation repair protein [Chitinophagaceae bacterium]|nr:DNA alkylation repair protein [Chitinophagaceae bacterium]